MKIKDKETFDQVNVFGQGPENSAYAQYFIGTSYLNPLTKPGESTIALANVTFEPGCRNNCIFIMQKPEEADPYLHSRKRLVPGGKESSCKS